MPSGRTDCPVCRGVVGCKGGGNKQCRKRDPRSARIATILDTYGGARTIVGTLRSVRANTRQDELLHVVPNLIVHEPVAWNDIPIVIERARLELLKWLSTRPNLTEIEDLCVRLYHLRCLEHGGRGPRGTLNPFEGIVET